MAIALQTQRAAQKPAENQNEVLLHLTAVHAAAHVFTLIHGQII